MAEEKNENKGLRGPQFGGDQPRSSIDEEKPGNILDSYLSEVKSGIYPRVAYESDLGELFAAYGFTKQDIESKNPKELANMLKEKLRDTSASPSATEKKEPRIKQHPFEADPPTKEEQGALKKYTFTGGHRTTPFIQYPHVPDAEIEQEGQMQAAAWKFVESADKGTFYSPKNEQVRNMLKYYGFTEEEIDGNSAKELADMLRKKFTGTEGGIEDEPIETDSASDQTETNSDPAEENEENKKEAAEQIAEKELESENKALSLFGTSVEEVSKHVEGFDKLPHGKRMFVIENLRQLTLADVEEQAASDYHNTTGWRKLVQFIKNSGTPLARAKKQAIQETLSAGIETHKDMLSKLVDGAEGMPDAKETEDGSLEIQFFDVSTFPEGSPEREAAEKFNAVATEKTYMPTEWKYDAEHWEGLLRRTGNGPSGLRAWLHKPSRENYEKYHELKSRYDERRKQLLEILRERGDERSASLEMNDLDAQISAHQQLNTHPDSEKALLSLRDDGLWKQVFQSISTGRGVQFGAGFAIRSLSTAAFGIIAAPIAGGAISGFRGRSSAWSDLKEQYIADLYKESGELSEEEQASARKEMREARVAGKLDAEKNIVASDKLIEKLENITQEAELENLTDLQDPAQQKVLARIQARIGYTTRKLDEGLVNFGKGTNALDRQYRLTQALSHAHVQAGALAGHVDAEAEGEAKDAIAKKVDVLNERLNNTLDIRAVRINDARFAQVKRKIVDQALVGAGFGLAGALFADALNNYGTDKSSYEPYPPRDAFIDRAPDVSNTETSGMYGPLGIDPEAKPIPNMEVTIKSGGSLWGAIESKLESQGMLADMNEAQRTHAIDAIKDEFAKMSASELREQVGISSGNIDRIQAGETIDLSSVMERAGLVEQATENARALSAEQIQSITQNNEVLRAYVENHPNERLTSERVEEILKGDIERAYASSGQVPTTGEQTAPSQNTGGSLLSGNAMEESAAETSGVTSSQSETGSAQVVDARLENDLNNVLGIENALESDVWNQLREMNAQGVREIPRDNLVGETASVGRMQEYLNNIVEQTRITPEPNESIDAYLRRAVPTMIQ